jgi:hypothetical protein
MKNLILGIILGSALTAAVGGAADYLGAGRSYLHPNETQAILGEIRVREALETIQIQRQNYIDQQVRDSGRVPCR